MSNLEFITCNKRKYSFQASRPQIHHSIEWSRITTAYPFWLFGETVANLFCLVAHFDILPNGSLLKIKPLRITILPSREAVSNSVLSGSK